MRNTKMFKQGLAVRHAVLGAEYVDRVMANADAFTGTLQGFATGWC